MRHLFFYFHISLFCITPHQNPSYHTYFLSSQKSGTNLVTTTLCALTRKPIVMFLWGVDEIPPGSYYTKFPEHNRLNLPLNSSKALLFRTHNPKHLANISPRKNKLIFLTRNPKELIGRKMKEGKMSEREIEKFVDLYLSRFKLYEKWEPRNRLIIFYEDVIAQENNSLYLKILHFMGEKTKYLDEYNKNCDKYKKLLFSSYKEQHAHEYTDNARLPRSTHIDPLSTPYLKKIDQMIEKKEPKIWKRYLSRFKSLSLYF